MKLRSGKTLSTFPSKLNNELETKLETFKTLFSGNPQHAKELLDIIRENDHKGARFIIRDKIEEIYDDNTFPGGLAPLLSISGDLTWLLIDYPQYHDTIETRMENFDLDTPLAGSIEELL